MSSAMRKIFFLSLCLICSILGRRIQSSRSAESGWPGGPTDSLARLLLVSRPASGFAPSGQGVQLPVGSVTRTISHPATRCVTMKEVQTVDTVDDEPQIEGFTDEELLRAMGRMERKKAREATKTMEMINENGGQLEELDESQRFLGPAFPEQPLEEKSSPAKASGKATAKGKAKEIPVRRRDGNGYYTMEEFKAYYGDLWEEHWNDALPAPGVKLYSELNVGDVIEEARVESKLRWGVFLDIGAQRNVLCHVSRIDHAVWEELAVGDKMKVEIMDIDAKHERCHVTALEEKKPLTSYQVGEIVEGQVIKFEDWGARVEIGCTRMATLHKTEVSHSWVKDVEDHVTLGEKLRFIIKAIDLEERFINLSLKSMPSAALA